jgi:hypothetical protein
MYELITMQQHRQILVQEEGTLVLKPTIDIWEAK